MFVNYDQVNSSYQDQNERFPKEPLRDTTVTILVWKKVRTDIKVRDYNMVCFA